MTDLSIEPRVAYIIQDKADAQGYAAHTLLSLHASADGGAISYFPLTCA